MAIDNDIYSRESFGWWKDDPNSIGVMLRYFINPVRFAYFMEILKQKSGGNVSGKKLLDVGCGGGYLSEEFAKTGLDVTGIDPSQNTLRAARAHAAQSLLRIDYEEGRAEAIPFVDSSFDYVCCCDVLEHVDDVNATISEIARVLKPGGLFFYDTINRTFLSWLMTIKIAQDWKCTAWEAPNTHEWMRYVKPMELDSIMNANGLVMHGIKGIGVHSGPLVIWRAIRQRAKGEISRYEMGTRFGFERNDKVGLSYMGFAIEK
jgi:2-polyprenyl-6-hydroxyphenyl methylase / 3-demethylubiquinone-9 3-methyltransferase